MTIEGKHFVEVTVKALDPTEEFPNGSFEAVLSDPTEDRDGEIIDPGAFEVYGPLPEYMPALADHERSVATTVGWGVPSYEDGKFMFRGPFDPDDFSQLVRAKIKSGSIRKMSVGFRNAVRKVIDGVVHIVSAEPLEGSFVVIPANPNATIQSVKSYGEIEPPAGSFEEVQEDALEALRLFYADAYVCLIATFTDHVVYEVCHWPAEATDGTFSLNYSNGADGELVLDGEPSAVEVEQVITPKALEMWVAKKAMDPNINNKADTPSTVTVQRLDASGKPTGDPVTVPIVGLELLTAPPEPEQPAAAEIEAELLDIELTLDEFESGESYGTTDQLGDLESLESELGELLSDTGGDVDGANEGSAVHTETDVD